MDEFLDRLSTDPDVAASFLPTTSSWPTAIPFGCSGTGRPVSCTTIPIFLVLVKLTHTKRESSVLSCSLLRHRRPARHLAVLHRGGITGRYGEPVLKAMGHSPSCHADLQVVIVRRSCFDSPSCEHYVCSGSSGRSSIRTRCSCAHGDTLTSDLAPWLIYFAPDLAARSKSCTSRCTDRKTPCSPSRSSS
jgi:hypothetical protein